MEIFLPIYAVENFPFLAVWPIYAVENFSFLNIQKYYLWKECFRLRKLVRKSPPHSAIILAEWGGEKKTLRKESFRLRKLVKSLGKESFRLRKKVKFGDLFAGRFSTALR